MNNRNRQLKFDELDSYYITVEHIERKTNEELIMMALCKILEGKPNKTHIEQAIILVLDERTDA